MSNSFSSLEPAVGRLMLANSPPLGFSQFHTLGGAYSVVSVIFYLIKLSASLI